jgi:hypothetical protein
MSDYPTPQAWYRNQSMKIFANLRQLLEQLDSLQGTDLVWLPGKLPSLDRAGDLDVLLGADARFLSAPAEAPPRQGYRLWLDVDGLRQILAGLAPGCSDQDLLAALQVHLGRESWDEPPTEEPPSLSWPEFTDAAAQLDWWLACARAYADLWGERARLTPSSRAELFALEQRLGCSLPTVLRDYHLRIGALELSERLCSVTPAEFASIEPLIEAYPGIVDILEGQPDAESQWSLIDELVVFGDYLGNGNLWCFHRQTGEVWYFDHDSPPMLARLFKDVGGFLDALMFKCLLEIHQQDDDSEQLLRQQLGDAVVDKWMY